MFFASITWGLSSTGLHYPWQSLGTAIMHVTYTRAHRAFVSLKIIDYTLEFSEEMVIT